MDEVDRCIRNGGGGDEDYGLCMYLCTEYGNTYKGEVVGMYNVCMYVCMYSTYAIHATFSIQKDSSTRTYCYSSLHGM